VKQFHPRVQEPTLIQTLNSFDVESHYYGFSDTGRMDITY